MKRVFEYIDRRPFVALGLFLTSFALILFAGTKPDTPPPVVLEEGIEITKCDVTPQGVTVEWETEDERIKDGETEYVIEFRQRPLMLGDNIVQTPEDLSWKELGRTYDKVLAKEKIFLLHGTHEIRVRADVTETVE